MPTTSSFVVVVVVVAVVVIDFDIIIILVIVMDLMNHCRPIVSRCFGEHNRFLPTPKQLLYKVTAIYPIHPIDFFNFKSRV